MKRSLTVLLAILMVLTFLSGCGGSATIAETTAAPTEPPSFFEEQGFQEWEGFTVEADPEVREIHATATILNAAELFFYKEDSGVATEILHKEIIEADVDVHIATYDSDEFGMEGISDVVDSFYQKAVEDGEIMTKEEWLAAHEDYVVYNFWNRSEVNTSEHNDAFWASYGQEFSYYVQGNYVCLMDGYTGNVLMPSDHMLHMEKKEGNEIFAISSLDDFLKDTESSERDNWTVWQDMYVMVPKNYTGLAFVYGGYATYSGTDEEFLADRNEEDEEEEISEWKQLSYQEYKNEFNFLTEYFFTPADLDEEDTRPAPAVGTFFDKMDIEANMEKFEVAESLSDSGVKEIHWNNPISIPGAEVIYFNTEKRSAKSYIEKKLANCVLDIYAREYTADQFSSQDIQDIINKFYQADDSGLSKAQWLQEYQSYKLMHFASEAKFMVSYVTGPVVKEHGRNIWYWTYTNWPKLIDQYTGNVFMPQSGSQSIVEEFTTSDIEFSVIYTRASEWDHSTSSYGNYREDNDIYVLVPADYDGLSYALVLYDENRTDEDILALFDNSESTTASEESAEAEEETSTWWNGDFYEEEPHMKRYYFIPAN